MKSKTSSPYFAIKAPKAGCNGAKNAGAAVIAAQQGVDQQLISSLPKTIPEPLDCWYPHIL
jgi:hypothetical protein